MRKTIVRTIQETTIESAMVSIVKGKPVLLPNDSIVINGVITEEKALVMASKKFNAKGNIIITEIKTVDDVYEISVEDFIKYATKVNKVETEEKEVNNAD